MSEDRSNDPKQVIIWRNELKVHTGKKCAQAGHAALKGFLEKEGTHFAEENGQLYLKIPIGNDYEHAWLKDRFTKIVLKVETEQELLDIYEQAQTAGLLSTLVQDAGFTEFNGVPTYTCVSIGPADPKEIDKITRHLKTL